MMIYPIVIREVSHQYKVGPGDITGATKTPVLVSARVSTYIVLTRFSIAMVDISKVLNRDHSVISHYAKKSRVMTPESKEKRVAEEVYQTVVTLLSREQANSTVVSPEVRHVTPVELVVGEIMRSSQIGQGGKVAVSAYVRSNLYGETAIPSNVFAGYSVLTSSKTARLAVESALKSYDQELKLNLFISQMRRIRE